MPSGTIDKVIIALHHLVVEERRSLAKRSSSRDGFSFEDRVGQDVYDCVRRYPMSVSPPRTTLNYPTVSGIKHQFDVVMTEGHAFFVIECKRRGLALIDQIFSFNSKILDYALKDSFSSHFGIKGIFLSTAKITDNIRRYSFAYGITPIDSALPPIELMLDKTGKSDNIRRELVKVKDLLASPQPFALRTHGNGHELFQRYMICFQKWKAKGYL